MDLNHAQKHIVLSLENLMSCKGFPSLKSSLKSLESVDSGTIVIRFRNYQKQGYMPLLSIANNQYPSSYVSLYIEHAGKIGFKKHLISSNKMVTHHIDLHKETVVDPNFIHTVAISVVSKQSYTLFFNGEKVAELKDENASLLKDIQAVGIIDKGILGAFYESQKIADNHYEFSGDFDMINIYDVAVDEQSLIELTKESSHKDTLHTPLDIYYPGLAGSSNFRIPTLLLTTQGTLISSVDKRMYGHQDHSNKIDTIIRRSHDQGNTWDEPITACKLFGNGQTIDSCILEDKQNTTLYILNNSHPDCLHPFESKVGSSQIEHHGEMYFIIESSTHKYYGHKNGQIFSESFEKTKYTYDEEYNLFCNKKYVDNLFNSDSPLKIYQSTYTLLTHSHDDGITWSKPKILNDLKQSHMKSLNVAPGIGIQIENGDYKGRLCFPLYYYNLNGYASSLITFSDDHGETWYLGESVNDDRFYKGRLLHSKSISQEDEMLTECQIVEMPNGYLKLFMRNLSGHIAIATSRDGGLTWDDRVIYDQVLIDPSCQSTIIKFKGKIDNHDAVIFANASDVSRATGKIKIGLLSYNSHTDDYNIHWKYDYLLKPGSYAYSCLTQIDDNNIGIVYEGTPSTYLSFQSITLDELKDTKTSQSTINYDFKIRNGSGILTFTDSVMFIGNRDLVLQYDSGTYKANYQFREGNQYYYVIDFLIEDSNLQIKWSSHSYRCDTYGRFIL